VQLTPGWTPDACRESRPRETAESTFGSTHSRHRTDATSAPPAGNSAYLDPIKQLASAANLALHPTAPWVLPSGEFTNIILEPLPFVPYHLDRRGLDLPRLMLRPIPCWPIVHALPEWEGRVESVSRCKWCAATVTSAGGACA